MSSILHSFREQLLVCRLGVFPTYSDATTFTSSFAFATGAVNILSALIGEEYDKPPEAQAKKEEGSRAESSVRLSCSCLHSLLITCSRSIWLAVGRFLMS